ncbi:DUF3310 domain-containing protein [Furfurilactobacillus entadae]|uniref:DUF3310 domain-containing protein n=1 Tax=Furfurilactobacillus entadae TaxID=2922307 RepID=UPI0035E924B0
MIEPKYYKGANGKDLIDSYAEQMTPERFRGFMIGNIGKYLTRYLDKNGVEDLDKAMTYIRRLKQFEEGND